MPISLPATPGFRAVRFGLATNTQMHVSPLSRSEQRLKLPGARWSAQYSVAIQTVAQMAEWQAFFLKLDGAAGTFYAFEPGKETPRGTATGTPLVNGGSQTGETLVTDGWSNSITGILKTGDYFTVNGELKMITADIDSDGSGNATLQFKPALRSSPADNAAITVNTATCIMRLIDDDQANWERTVSGGFDGGFYEEFSFSAIETFST